LGRLPQRVQGDEPPRILYVAILILAVAAVQAGFPLAPKHSALLSMFAVGLPRV
jgi:hypothetical protein